MLRQYGLIRRALIAALAPGLALASCEGSTPVSTDDPEDVSTAVELIFQGRIDLANLANYANPSIPGYITLTRDDGNPITDAGATLGRVLFYDPALSVDNTVSCASCHLQALAFTDDEVVSEGVEGGLTGRHSMRMVNTRHANERRFFWDERAASHEAQETQPLRDNSEHGFSGVDGRPDFDDLITKLEAIDYYQELFTFVFGDSQVTETRLQLALAQFTKSITSFDSRYDVGRAQVGGDLTPFPNFTADENAGKELFIRPQGGGGAGCNGCHNAPEFDIDPNSGHNGVVGVAGDPNGVDLTNTRAPTLRDVVGPDGEPHGPFMHDGSLETLREVVDHYANIQVPVAADAGQFVNTLDNRLKQGNTPQTLNLTEAQRNQLVAFLQTLSGESVYTDERWSDPFGG